ncbi:hypothetical protein BGX26_006430, partial [Mortierella sp. AD094]
VDDSMRSDRTAFTKELLDSNYFIEPATLTIPETKELFRKHFEKIQSPESTKRLLSMTMKDDETFEDYANRISLEVMRSARLTQTQSRLDDFECILTIRQYMEGTLPSVAQEFLLPYTLINHLYVCTGHSPPNPVPNSLRMWMVSCQSIQGKRQDDFEGFMVNTKNTLNIAIAKGVAEGKSETISKADSTSSTL